MYGLSTLVLLGFIFITLKITPYIFYKFLQGVIEGTKAAISQFTGWIDLYALFINRGIVLHVTTMRANSDNWTFENKWFT